MKRYAREAGTTAVRRWLETQTGAASRLSEVEVASALVRRSREGACTAQERDRALASLDTDMAALLVVELTPQIALEARELLLRHRLRAGDAVQLASGLFLEREVGETVPFVVFDDRLADAARVEGLTVAGLP